MTQGSIFADRTAWVTGASSGIGASLALALARRGARLILSARRLDRLEQVRERCEGGAEHTVLPLDLEKVDTLAAVAQGAVTDHGPIDFLFHAGGLGQRALAMDTDLVVDRRIMDVNYFGTVALTKAVLPSMLERGSGHVVPISSLVGKFGTPQRSAYAASKHALHGFFDSLRAELHGQGVHITVVCPGFVSTELSLQALTGDGTPQGHRDETHVNGMDADVCAEKILTAVARRRAEVNIGGSEVLGVYVKRLAPWLFDRIIRRARVT